MSDDISKWMADLAEANRRSKLQYYRFDDPETHRMNFKVDGVDFDSPVFYMGSLFTDPTTISPNVQQWFDDAKKDFDNGVLKAPYPKSFRIHKPTANTPKAFGHVKTPTIHVDYVVQESDTSFWIKKFILYQEPGRDIWVTLPCKVFMTQAQQVTYEIQPDVNRNDKLDREVNALVGIELVTTWLLTRPHELTQTTLPVGERAIQVNRGRANAKLGPLGQIIQITVNPKPTPPVQPILPVLVGSGTPKRPHDRRGTWVQRKDIVDKGGNVIRKGKRFWRESATIHKDQMPARPTAPVYVVDVESDEKK